ncbi:MAG: hypothetical protein R2710_17350 [Acidimicrobiales bacterium]
MTDFEPTTDFPESIDADDTPIQSSAAARDEQIQRRRRNVLFLAVVGLTAGLIGFGLEPLRVVIAMVAFYLILRIGIAVLGAFARPIPEPPPPGELRRVKLVYRCSSCGAELRMTLANDQVPQPPRHCADEMDLLTSLDELL